MALGRESPDPLMEHSNSVQEPGTSSSFKKKDNQSSLSDIHFAGTKAHLAGSKNAVPIPDSRNNVNMNRKLQFYTSNNFYPGGGQNFNASNTSSGALN